jgi:hypothetical protein
MINDIEGRVILFVGGEFRLQTGCGQLLRTSVFPPDEAVGKDPRLAHRRTQRRQGNGPQQSGLAIAVVGKQ